MFLIRLLYKIQVSSLTLILTALFFIGDVTLEDSSTVTLFELYETRPDLINMFYALAVSFGLAVFISYLTYGFGIFKVKPKKIGRNKLSLIILSLYGVMGAQAYFLMQLSDLGFVVVDLSLDINILKEINTVSLILYSLIIPFVMVPLTPLLSGKKI